MEASLHGAKGGKKARKAHMPSESEAFALAVGCALLWAKLRSSDNPSFFTTVAEEVQRCESTLVLWTHGDMKYIFHDRILCGIGQNGFKKYLQREYSRKQALVAHDERAKHFVATINYRFLATANRHGVMLRKTDALTADIEKKTCRVRGRERPRCPPQTRPNPKTERCARLFPGWLLLPQLLRATRATRATPRPTGARESYQSMEK